MAGEEVSSVASGVGVVAAIGVFLRWLLTLAGARQDARIAKLEREVKGLTSRLMLVAQAAMELSADMERLDPSSLTLKRARVALKKAFPVENDPPEDLVALADKVDTKD